MEEDTPHKEPWLIELLRHVEDLAIKCTLHEREASARARLSDAWELVDPTVQELTKHKHKATQTERQALIAAVLALRNLRHAEELMVKLGDNPIPADLLSIVESYAMLASYRAGYAQAMANQAMERKNGGRTRAAPTNRTLEALAREIEQAAKSHGSAAGLAEKLAPKLSRSTAYLERKIREARKRQPKTGHQ